MALLSLQLHNFVIVERLQVEFGAGFTALTGETGAGKSILIDALQLVLGARADAGVVREGCEKTELTATFDVPKSAESWLDEAGLDFSEDVVIVRRQITAAGKSRAWINGSPVTATQLRGLGDLLVDIHGQHAWTQLSKPESVRQLLDGWADIDTEPVQAAYQVWRTAEKTLLQASANASASTAERERLEWQINEVNALAPKENEWDELEAEHQVQSSAQDVLQACTQAMGLLDSEASDASGEVSNVLDLMDSVGSVLQPFADLTPEMQAVVEQLDNCMTEVQDANRRLRSIRDGIVPDEERLAFLDARVGLWLSLARKYKCEPAALPATLQTWQSALEALQAGSDVQALQVAVDEAKKKLLQAAQHITKARTTAAAQLSEQVTASMQGLGMEGGCFTVELLALNEPASHGMEDVQFCLAGHPGATPKPVHKIASGGELSRIALAIAVCTSKDKSTPTLVFDEVDAGIGGVTANTVGELMRGLGEKQQVMAVTHLAQVAAQAHQQHQVRKVSQNGHTNSAVELLNYKQRVVEVARMLGGAEDDPASIAHAKVMLETNTKTAKS